MQDCVHTGGFLGFLNEGLRAFSLDAVFGEFVIILWTFVAC